MLQHQPIDLQASTHRELAVRARGRMDFRLTNLTGRRQAVVIRCSSLLIPLGFTTRVDVQPAGTAEFRVDIEPPEHAGPVDFGVTVVVDGPDGATTWSGRVERDVAGEASTNVFHFGDVSADDAVISNGAIINIEGASRRPGPTGPRWEAVALSPDPLASSVRRLALQHVDGGPSLHVHAHWELAVGRATDGSVDVRVDESFGGCSRRHFLLQVDERDGLWVRHLSRTNPTYVDGRPFTEDVELPVDRTSSIIAAYREGSNGAPGDSSGSLRESWGCCVTPICCRRLDLALVRHLAAQGVVVEETDFRSSAGIAGVLLSVACPRDESILEEHLLLLGGVVLGELPRAFEHSSFRRTLSPNVLLGQVRPDPERGSGIVLLRHRTKGIYRANLADGEHLHSVGAPRSGDPLGSYIVAV